MNDSLQQIFNDHIFIPTVAFHGISVVSQSFHRQIYEELYPKITSDIQKNTNTYTIKLSLVECGIACVVLF